MKKLKKDRSVDESLSLVEEAAATSLDSRRKGIFALERLMVSQEQAPIPVNHRFTGGMYSREIIIPKGTLLTGRIHKFDHFDIMLSGDITVSTDDGGTKRFTGLNIFEGKAGKKRAGVAHEDTHWITFHSAEERNPDDMVEFLTCGSFEELEVFNLMLKNATMQIEEDEKILLDHAKSICSKGDICP